VEPLERADPKLPALVALEVASIARGLSVVDALVKRAEVRLLAADPVSPGKYLVVFAGFEAEARESLDAALELAAGDAIDSFFLPQAHRALVEGLRGLEVPPLVGALGTLEMRTASATLLAADAALKSANVALVAIRLAKGIGGRGYVAFTGTQDSVEAALLAGDDAVDHSQRFASELIARPHPDLDWVLARL
jgi:microcompartment protein CcmL/EutN